MVVFNPFHLRTTSALARLQAYLKIGLLSSLLLGCQAETSKKEKRQHSLEAIKRHEGDQLYALADPEMQDLEPYPWEERYIGGIPKVTQDFFRCRGSSLNPVHVVEVPDQEPMRYYDCNGRHGLSLKDAQEFVYPELIHILNRIQEKTKKRVVITCGYRCPTHNSYADPSRYNRTSKHMIAAEVDFYVEGMEDQAQELVELIMDGYDTPFLRYTKDDTNVTTLPWYNDRIFIKLFLKGEGRDFDNRHPYPYIGIQVRYHEGKRVSYTWEQANKYLRG